MKITSASPKWTIKSRSKIPSLRKDGKQDDYYNQCPNTREALGFFTWNYLHTMSLYYPEKPTQEQQGKMNTFMHTFAEFYPCKCNFRSSVCAAHFTKDITDNPPKVASRQDFAVWLCERHNSVNSLLGKPTFDCSYQSLFKRWRDGGEHCTNPDF